MEFIENITHEYPGIDEIRLKCGAVIMIDNDGEEIRIGIYNTRKTAMEGQPDVFHVLPKTQPTTEELIRRAADKAQEAFWMAVVDAFPKIHGDLDPLQSHAIDDAMFTAVASWVKNGDPIE